MQNSQGVSHWSERLSYVGCIGWWSRLRAGQAGEEVWSEPVTAVAKRYGVSDVAIHKTCKRLAIPVRPRLCWAELGAGSR